MDLYHRLVSDEEANVAELEALVRRFAAKYRQELGPDADDVVQESLMRIVGLIRDGTYEHRETFESFAWRLTTRDCIDRLRAIRRKTTLDLSDDDLARMPATTHLPTTVDARITASVILAAAPSDCQRIWAGVAAGHSMAELAKELGVSSGSVRAKALRCRRWAAHKFRKKKA